MWHSRWPRVRQKVVLEKYQANRRDIKQLHGDFQGGMVSCLDDREEIWISFFRPNTRGHRRKGQRIT